MSKLVNFDDPPVVETVLSIQFKKLTSLRSVHFWQYWERQKDRFPKTEEHPALAHVIEQQEFAAPKIRFETIDIMPQRLLLVNEESGEMIQVQNDRFIKNWRKNGDSGYPRYEPVIKPGFEKDYSAFQQFIESEKLGSIAIDQCEVTYVNHIIAGEGWKDWSDIDQIFSFINTTDNEFRASDLAMHQRYPINAPDGQWIGWLHVDIQPALSLESQNMYVMNMTARGMYGSGYEFFDIGREKIVKTFAHLTTKNMHNLWGKN